MINAIDITMPRSWSELTPKQFRLAVSILSVPLWKDSVSTIFFLRLAGIEVLAVRGDSASIFIKSHSKRCIQVSCADIARGAECVSFISQPPFVEDIAAGISAFSGSRFRSRRHSILPDFSNADLKTYIAADSAYTGFMMTEDPTRASELADIIFPALGKSRRSSTFSRTLALLWMAALKRSLSRLFPDFLKAQDPATSISGSGSDPSAFAESVNAMIRALTKGDIAREDEILSANLYRALEELNALARESEQLRNISKN